MKTLYWPLLLSLFLLLHGPALAETIPLSLNLPEETHYSNFEGVLAPGHDHELDRVYRKKYFYNESNEFTPERIDAFVSFFEERKTEISESIRMSKKDFLIRQRNFNQEDAHGIAEKELDEEAEIIHAFDLTIKNANNLLDHYKDLNAQQIRDRVETIILFAAICRTITPESIFTGTWKLIRTVYHNVYGLYKNDKNFRHATNLVSQGKFLSAAEIKTLAHQGYDISTLNPPSSAFWTNNNVEAYQPLDEKFYGQRLFPENSGEIGDEPVFHYKRMGNGTIKIKANWFDSEELTKKGKPKKKSITLRLGFEAQTSVLSAHIARAVGYPASPVTYRKRVKLILGDISYEEFVSQWLNAHTRERGGPATFVEKIPGENAIFLNGVCLEAYPDEEQYRTLGPYRSSRNGFTNRREYRALLLYSGLIAEQDTGDTQLRVDTYLDPKTGVWMPQFFIVDTGWSMGSWLFTNNPGAPNEYMEWFTTKNSNKVTIWWQHSDFDPDTYLSTLYSDAKWLARRYSRLSEKQIIEIFKSAGHPDSVRELFIERFKRRLNKMIMDFDLEKEGFKPHPLRSYNELHQMFPKEINSFGYLRESINERSDVRASLTGSNMTLPRLAETKAIEFFQKKLNDLITLSPELFGFATTFELGDFKLEWGPNASGSRTIKKNKEGGPGQKSFMVTDTYKISIPIGLINLGNVAEKFKDRHGITLPIGLSYIYEYEYHFSVTTPSQAITKKFFNNMSPWSLYNISHNLGTGDVLMIRQSFGFNLGKLQIKLSDNLEASASLLGFNQNKIQEMTVSKPRDHVVEIVKGSLSNSSLNTGIEITAWLKLALNASKDWSTSRYTSYILDGETSNEEYRKILDSAYNKAMLNHDYRELEKIGKRYEINLAETSTQGTAAFLLWSWSKGKSSGEADIKQYELEKNLVLNDTGAQELLSLNRKLKSADLILTQSQYSSTDRVLDRLWTDKIKIDILAEVDNILGKAFGEGSTRGLNLEAKINSDITKFDDIKLSVEFVKTDQWCTRSEWEQEWHKFFNYRASPKGGAPYLTYKMPEGINHYSPITGVMRWEMGLTGINELLDHLQNNEGLKHIQAETFSNLISSNNPSLKKEFKKSNQQQIIQLINKFKAEISPQMSVGNRKGLLKEKVSILMEIMRRVIGNDYSQVGLLRSTWKDANGENISLVSDENLWVVTTFSGVLDKEVPVSVNKYYKLFAPEIGRYQGPLYSTQFRFTHSFLPELYYSPMHPKGYAHGAGDAEEEGKVKLPF